MENKQVILSLEGNIGAGKSTFLRILEKSEFKNDFKVFQEPVNQWQDIGNGINLLEMLYTDSQRYAYIFQSYALLSRLKQFQEVQNTKEYNILITERSIESDKNVFAYNFKQQGVMNDIEMELYNGFFDQLYKNSERKVDGFVYLQTSPETCQKRCIKRNRSEENTIQLSYLQQLHECHQKWLLSPTITTPVLIINTELEFETNIQHQNTLLNDFNSFINLIQNQKHQYKPYNNNFIEQYVSNIEIQPQYS